MMIRIGLESAESAIPGINDLLAELATLGVNHGARAEAATFGLGVFFDHGTIVPRVSTAENESCGTKRGIRRRGSRRSGPRWAKAAPTCRPIPPFAAPAEGRAAAEQRYQLAELERSIRHCHDVLGLG